MQKGSAKTLFVCLIILVAVGWVLLPKYFGQLERSQALAMQIVLVEATIAQEQVFAKQQHYTADWSELVPLMTFSSTLEVQSNPMAGGQMYFFGFGKDALKKENGFVVGAEILAEGQGGVLQAERSGTLFYKYRLTRTFPEGETQCVATRGKGFCKRLIQSMSELEFKNLIPVPSEMANK